MRVLWLAVSPGRGRRSQHPKQDNVNGNHSGSRRYDTARGDPLQSGLRYIRSVNCVRIFWLPSHGEPATSSMLWQTKYMAGKYPNEPQDVPRNLQIVESELASEAYVWLRSIQMYEQRNKDINRAQAITIIKIAHAVGCETENLLKPGQYEL